MPITDKYEKLIEDAPGQFRAQHARLGRSVEIYRIDCGSEQAAQRIREIASQMSRLDHPLIPYLIDFLEDDTTCHLVVEKIESADSDASIPSPTEAPEDPTEWLDQLSLFEQLADALHHAAERGVAHGSLDLSCVHRAGKGVTKLSGLGLQQLNASPVDIDLAQLLRDDLLKLKQFVTACLRKASAHADEDSNELQAIQKLQQRIGNEDDDISRFSSDLRTWLHRELAIHEAKKLAFADRETPSPDVAETPNSRAWLVAGAAVGCLLLSGLLGYLLWPSTPHQTASNVDKNVTGEIEERPDDRPAASTSTLQNVGKLNNASPENANDLGSAEANDAAQEQTPEPEAKPEPVNAPEPVADPAPDPDPAPDRDPELVPEVAATRTKSPFENIAATFDLPPTESTDVIHIFETDLGDDEPMLVKLLSNPATAKRPEFSLQEDKSRQIWNVMMRRKAESSVVAMFAKRDAKLSFRWTSAAKESPHANELRNAVVEYRHKTWTHHLALRQPILRPAASFDLERNRPYNLDIAHTPSNMFLEFVPSDDSLAVASPPLIPWDKDAMMTIGLDAGKESLVILQIKPQARAKLRTAGLARQSTESRRLPIKKGFGRGLTTGMRTLNKSLYGMKEGVKTIKGKNAAENKKMVNARIKLMEEQKKLSEVFMESYAAAAATKLHLRVYSEVGGHKIVLLDFSDETDAAQESR